MSDKDSEANHRNEQEQLEPGKVDARRQIVERAQINASNSKSHEDGDRYIEKQETIRECSISDDQHYKGGNKWEKKEA